MVKRTTEDVRLRTGRRAGSTVPVLFFDGECHLCNGFVDLALSSSGGEKVRFAPIQGDTAHRLLEGVPEDTEDWAIIYLDETGLHVASDAVLRLAVRVGGFWNLGGIFFAVPRFLRNLVYRWIAHHRYRLFGRRNSCRVPPRTKPIVSFPESLRFRVTALLKPCLHVLIGLLSSVSPSSENRNTPT